MSQKRKQYIPQFKAKVALAAIRGDETIANYRSATACTRRGSTLGSQLQGQTCASGEIAQQTSEKMIN